ncbi:MAG: tetratricopeptide repeat protein, partial [Myxococcaceae bacterium]|nr:tetratricopeptide repeat protein [Myxococcaceae bacterium]
MPRVPYRRLMASFLALAVSAVLLAPPPVREPKELIAIVENSPRTYAFKTVERVPEQWRQQAFLTMYPQSASALSEPRLGPDGRVSEAPVIEELDALLAPVEEKFEARAWAEAEKGYAALLEKYPNHYALTLNWGDAALKDGRPEVALKRYRAAQKLNPLDHRGFFYEGSALVALKKPKEALAAYARALARRPNAPYVLSAIDSLGDVLGIRVRTLRFLPAARVDPNGDGFDVSLADPRWMAWGLCKAAWRGEVSARTVADPQRWRLVTVQGFGPRSAARIRAISSDAGQSRVEAAGMI